MPGMTTPRLSCLLVGCRPGIFLDSCVCEECEPYFPVARLLGIGNFWDYFGRAENTASDNIQEIIILSGSLM